MATEKFNSLKEYKKESILKAAKSIFANSDYADISINQIIEKAKISRGSFYLYFADKKDVYYTTITYIKNQIKQDTDAIYALNIPLKSTLLQFYDYFTNSKNVDYDLYKRVFSNFSADGQRFLKNTASDLREHTLKAYKDYYLKSHDEMSKEEERKMILVCDMLGSMVFCEVSDVMETGADKVQKRKDYEEKLNILSEGLKILK